MSTFRTSKPYLYDTARGSLRQRSTEARTGNHGRIEPIDTPRNAGWWLVLAVIAMPFVAALVMALGQ